jgi:hypothetical protein
MPAVVRPSIIEETFKSFTDCVLSSLLDKQIVHLYLNVDPVGETDSCTPQDIALMARKYFLQQNIHFSTPDAPNFAKAFWKVMSGAVTADYVFYLEDDWVFNKTVDLLDMIDIMDTEPGLALLRLPAFSTGFQSMKNWTTFYPWAGRYFICPQDKSVELGFCGHPSLIRGKFLDRTVAYLDLTRNPEKQYHHGDWRLLDEVRQWRYGVYAERNAGPTVRDIGRAWIANSGWRKEGVRAFFTRWTQEPLKPGEKY